MSNALKVVPPETLAAQVKKASSDDLLSTLRLIFGYSEVLKHNLQSSFHLRASEDIEKINRAAYETLAAYGAMDSSKGQPYAQKSFDAEHFMQAFSHVAHAQMSPTCRALGFFVPQGFGMIQGDEDALMDICIGGLDFIQATENPERLSIHLYPSQADGKDFINIDLKASVPNLLGKFEGSLASFFHSRNPLRLQRACELLQAKFHLEVSQGHGLTFSVTFPDQHTRMQPGNLSRKEAPRPAILLLGTDQKAERMVRDIAKETELEIIAVSQLRSGLRVFFEKQPGFVMVDASEDSWGADELIDSIRQQNKTCYIVVLVHEGLSEYSNFPGSDLILEKPFKIDELLTHLGVFDKHNRRIATW